MRSQRRLVSPVSVNLTPNTFIGGVAAEIPTKAALATKLNIAESNISYFAVVGSDIETKIEIDYYFPHEIWSGNTSITYFKEKVEGRCVSMGRQPFKLTTKLREVEFLRDVLIEDGCFNKSSLLRGIFPNSTIMYYMSTFLDNSARLIYLPKLKFNFSLTQFLAFGSVKNIYMSIAEEIGSTQANNDHFSRSPQGVKIWANPVLQTSNNGAEEGDLAYARQYKSAIIDYSQMEPDFFILPNPITDLSFSKNGSDITITYSTPISVYQIVDFEIYVNDVLHSRNTTNLKILSGLIIGDRVKVKATDIYYNKSASNIITIS